MPMLGSMARDSDGGFGCEQIDLPEGVRIQALIDGNFGDWQIGMRMRTTMRVVGKDNEGDDICTFNFAPVGEVE